MSESLPVVIQCRIEAAPNKRHSCELRAVLSRVEKHNVIRDFGAYLAVDIDPCPVVTQAPIGELEDLGAGVSMVMMH